MTELRTEAGRHVCPVCDGDGQVYAMTAAYQAMGASAGGGSFSWTGPTHEWRSCRACGGTGLLDEPLPGRLEYPQLDTLRREAVTAALARLRARVEGLDAYDEDDGDMGAIYDPRAVYRAAVLAIFDEEAAHA